MKEVNAEQAQVETASALKLVQEAGKKRHAVYVGLDVHKETIAVAITLAGREEPAYRGEIVHTRKAVGKLVERLSTEFGGQVLLFCSEAGPCGYGL
jgi:transposase